MEDQWLKSNTDCVYYLASPLTCKKGIECEYRHSEIARLNPTDCWYWLAGSCLNSDCAFRHPPLDGPTDGSFESANIYQQHATSSKTTNVPCHFFFNGFCNKGERCSFFHGPSDNAHWDSSKTANAVASNGTVEKKINAGSDIGLAAPVVTRDFPLQKLGSNIKPEVEPHKLTSVDETQQIATLPSSESLSEEKALCRPRHPLPAREFMRGKSHASIDQSSGRQIVSHTKREEWLDSSPGFDVRVSNISEEFIHEDYPSGFLCETRESMKRVGHPYDEVDSNLRPYLGKNVKFDDKESYRHFDRFDIEKPYVRAEEIHRRLGKRGPELRLSQERMLTLAQRDLLRKRRSINDDYQDSFSRTSRSSQSEKRYRLLRGRSVSKVVSNHFRSRIDYGSFMRNSNHQSRMRHVHRSRQHFTGRRQGIDSYRPLITCSKKRLSSGDCLILKSPQEFSPVRESKRNRKEITHSRNRRETPSATIEDDFQGPKSLSEILKEKMMVRSVVTGIIDQ